MPSDTEVEDNVPEPASKGNSVAATTHSKGDNKRSKIIKRLVFGTLLLFLLCGIIAAGHLWTILFVSGCSTCVPTSCSSA